ncbi:MAG: PAS domain S-box protein [Deltaproteobacteria bacterium]|nr:PAS domain S-box protein [Deltaproteobacteria bacterium]
MTTARHASRTSPASTRSRVPAKVAAYTATKASRKAANVSIPRDELADLRGKAAAIAKAQAVIEFDLGGKVLAANDNFLGALGYQLDEIVGRHHSMFVDPGYVASAEYRAFWEKLGRGEYDAGVYKRIGKGGKAVWIQASYNPIFDLDGKPFKVVKYATDITQAKLAAADSAGQIAAIGKSQAVIEFNLDGNVITANDNFLNTLGYRLEEIRGQHHSLFVDPTYRGTPEYRAFWAKLGRGEYDAGEYKRIGKGGREVWIQASYNPILDLDGMPFKVVKYASDVTAQKLAAMKMQSDVDSILEVVRAVAEGDLSREIEVSGDDAIGQLGGGLAGCFGQLRRAQAERVEQERKIREASDRERRAAEELRVKVDSILAVVTAAAGGDLTRDVSVRGGDAVGQMGEGLAHFLGELRQSIGAIRQVAVAVGTSAGDLTMSAQSISANSEETSSQANVVAAAAEQVSHNVQTVATAAEEMSASIKEIAKNAAEAARVATSAVKVASDTNRTVSKLGDSSAEIGKVIKVITSIAQQTNLLALNATIEAARAGEAGKGFAVVANEVKELAKETAKATEDIGQKIEAIQTDTHAAVDAIGQISAIINQINDIQTAIASAVEEQTATTNEIGRNVGEAAQGSTEIAGNITGVAKAAQSTADGAATSLTSARELARMAEEMKSSLSRFRC